MRILFIADGALDRPLLHSQGIPLMQRLAAMDHAITILSFGDSTESMAGDLGKKLSEQGIDWVNIPTQGGRSQMVVNGFLRAADICRKKRIDLVHCRSYRPGMMGYFVKRCVGTGFLFDMRGFFVDEQVADGRWQAGTLKFRLAKWMERQMVKCADGLVATSPQFRQKILEMPYLSGKDEADRVFSIPNCTDTRHFRVDSEARAKIRAQYGWGQRWVCVFSGDAFRYRDTLEDIFAFFRQVLTNRADSLLLLLAWGDLQELNRRVQQAGLAEHTLVLYVPPKDVMQYLNAADIGLSFFRVRSFANAIASPIKFAEYLACGLPVVINPGVGDTGRILVQHHAGVVVNPLDEAQLRTGAAQVAELLGEGERLRIRCRQAAETELSLDYATGLYLAAYERVMEQVRKRRKV